MSVIAWLNSLDAAAATAVLKRCCGSTRWAANTAAERPFADMAQLHAAADWCWERASRDDVLEAFTHHPKIGANIESLRQRFASTASWSEGEQGAVSHADEVVLERLRDGNIAYEARFGYIFIVCATGKSAAEMLALLEARLKNSPRVEFDIAKSEQAKIMHLRIDKLEVE